MLADRNTPIVIIAQRLGMELSNFSRFIRKHLDCTPREYRESCSRGQVVSQSDIRE